MTSEVVRQPLDFKPSGWWYESQLVPADMLPRIGEEDVVSLLVGNPVQNPAQMEQFADLAAFRRVQYNFYAAFALTPGSWAWISYRRRGAFQRFELLHPEKVVALSNLPQHGPLVARPQEWWEMLHEAYQIMATLVSADDPYVKINGRVDPNYLVR